MRKFLYVFVSALSLCLAAGAQCRKFRLNGLEGAADTCLRRVLFTLPESMPAGSSAQYLSVTPVQSYAEVDGQAVGVDGRFILDEWQTEHRLTITDDDGKTETWTLAFTTLPLVVLDTSGLPVYKDSDTPATIEIVDAAGRLPGGTAFMSRCNVHHRGAFSYARYPKKSFTVKLLDGEGKKAETQFFGNRTEDTWVMDAMAGDMARMRNRVCFDIWNELDVKSEHAVRAGTQGQFVELTVNGRYAGLYCFGDKVNRTLLGAKKTKSTDKVRGVIYKGISWRGPSIVLMHDTEAPTDSPVWHNWEMSHPDGLPSAATWQPFFELVDFTDCGDFGRMARQWKDYFYAENAVAVPVFLSAFNLRDNFLKNAYLCLHDYSSGDFRWWIQPWDLDYGFNRDAGGSISTVQDDLEGIVHNTMPFSILLEYDMGDYRRLAAECWRDMRAGPLREDRVEERLRRYAGMFLRSGAWRREKERWDGNTLTLPDLEDEIDYMAGWYRNNCVRLDAYYAGLVSGIGTVDAGSTADSAGVYRLDGRRVAGSPDGIGRLPRGIYVIGGRKVMR